MPQKALTDILEQLDPSEGIKLKAYTMEVGCERST